MSHGITLAVGTRIPNFTLDMHWYKTAMVDLEVTAVFIQDGVDKVECKITKIYSQEGWWLSYRIGQRWTLDVDYLARNMTAGASGTSAGNEPSVPKKPRATKKHE